MTRHITLIVRLITTIGTAMALALTASAQTDAMMQDSTTSSPVAYVYVSGGTYKTSGTTLTRQLLTGRSHPCQAPPFGPS